MYQSLLKEERVATPAAGVAWPDEQMSQPQLVSLFSIKIMTCLKNLTNESYLKGTYFFTAI